MLLTCDNCGARFTPDCGRCRKCGQLGPIEDIRPYFAAETVGMLLRGMTEDDAAGHLASFGYVDDSIAELIQTANDRIQQYADIDSNQADYVASANTALSNAQHLGARWWNYSVSHHHFELLVGETNDDQHIVIALAECSWVSGPVSWPNQKVEIHWQNNRLSNGGWDFTLRDQSVSFEVRAQTFQWGRNHDFSTRQHWY